MSQFEFTHNITFIRNSQARVEAEKLAREQAAKEMVLGLGDSLGSLEVAEEA